MLTSVMLRWDGSVCRLSVFEAIWYTNHFKALRHGSHSITCNKHHACLYLVSVHQMAIEVANI